MPQLNAPIVLTDSVPADHSFAPRGIDANGVATLVKSSGVPIGDERLTVQRSRTAQGREKVSVKLTVPVVASETVGGVIRPSVVRAAYVDLTFSFDGASATVDRANVRKMMQDLLGEAAMVAVVDNLEYFY